MAHSAFEFDADRTVLDSLRQDTRGCMINALADMYNRFEGLYVDAAANVLVPEGIGSEGDSRKHSFAVGAAVVLAAFQTSSLEDEFMESVQNRFKFQKAPVEFLGSSPAQTMALFEAEEVRGKRSHKELHTYIDYASGHAATTLRHAGFGRIAAIGGWFTASRLDVCLEKQMQAEIRYATGQDTTSIDWDLEFAKWQSNNS